MTIPTILTSYRLMLPDIQLADAWGLMNWVEEVGFWLSRVDDTGDMEDTDQRRWLLVMAASLERKTRRPMGLCVQILEHHIVRNRTQGGIAS